MSSTTAATYSGVSERSPASAEPAASSEGNFNQAPLTQDVGASPETIRPATPEEVSSAKRAGKLGTVKLYYATDRQWTGSRDQPKWFGHEWNQEQDHLTYGTCDVSIPVAAHQTGEVEKPSIFRLEWTENPEKHVIVFTPQRLAKTAFFNALEADVRRRGQKEIVIFIHGFNNTFDDAASRLGVLAYDMEFGGVPVLYSWCSAGGFWGTRFYDHDGRVVEWTKEPLADFLASVAQTGRDAGARRVNIVAHSMGNRALVGALKILARTSPTMLFNEVVMAAPDVPAPGFETRDWRQMRGAVGPAQRVTLYASSDDKALRVSRGVSTFETIGQGGNKLLLIAGLDSIDATGVDFTRLGLNHSYFGGPRVLSDLRALLRQGLAPAQRRLRQMRRNELPYWLLPELARR